MEKKHVLADHVRTRVAGQEIEVTLDNLNALLGITDAPGAVGWNIHKGMLDVHGTVFEEEVGRLKLIESSRDRKTPRKVWKSGTMDPVPHLLHQILVRNVLPTTTTNEVRMPDAYIIDRMMRNISQPPISLAKLIIHEMRMVTLPSERKAALALEQGEVQVSEKDIAVKKSKRNFIFPHLIALICEGSGVDCSRYIKEGDVPSTTISHDSIRKMGIYYDQAARSFAKGVVAAPPPRAPRAPRAPKRGKRPMEAAEEGLDDEPTGGSDAPGDTHSIDQVMAYLQWSQQQNADQFTALSQGQNALRQQVADQDTKIAEILQLLRGADVQHVRDPPV